MRIVAIGDPHGDLESIRKIPLDDVDLILLTGDLGSASLARKMAFENVELKRKGLPEKEYSSAQEKKAFMEAYKSTISLFRYLSKFAPVFTVFGNVESSNKDTRKLSKKIGLPLPYLYDQINNFSGSRVINNVLANFQGARIGGLEYFVDTSWVIEFKPADYRESLVEAKKQTEKAKRVLDRFNSVDILVCHQPPYGLLDKVKAKFAPIHWKGKHAGSKIVLDYIKRKQPKYVFCGHIHESEGHVRVGKSEIYNLGVAGYKIIDL